MSEFVDLRFCRVAETPREFDIEKFKAGDPKQIELYSANKTPFQKRYLTYTQITDEKKPVNYARFVPKDCCFIDFDNPKEAEEMRKIILHAGLKCLILKTVHGYHFLFRRPAFYRKEMTKATNWFGFKFDAKQDGAVQLMRVCGMDREEVCSWDLEPVIPAKLDIEMLDVLPYWLWGKLKTEELHKEGKPGDSEYTIDNTPFTQLMKLKEGSRHNHIVERCSYFGISNGFTMEEFKELIQVIHDVYLIKLGSPMSESDLFGDLDERWKGYEATLDSSGWAYDEKERKWKSVKKKKDDRIDERRAAEYLYDEFDFYVKNKKQDGTYDNLLYRRKDGDYNYQTDLTVIRGDLKGYSDQNFKKNYFEEVEVQLMQMCAENSKLIRRSHEYVIAKNKILSCITPVEYDFSWLGTRPPTDVVLPWNWYSEEWVEEHKEDLGGIITKFIKELARDSSGKTQPEVEQWLWVIAGASMIPANDLQKIVVLAGGGANGKSLYTSLIRFCLGDDMYNTSKIFDSSPQDGFWGAGFDKGICCVVDDMPRLYNKDAFSYIKGAITGSDTVEINEKYKPKKKLSILPQIIACTNFEFELYDTSEGMRRRVCILPTEYKVPPELRDGVLQFKLVLNTLDLAEIAEYRMKNSSDESEGELIIKMRTREKGVLDSLKNGSLAWFANKARYEYFKAAEHNFLIGSSEGMKEKFEEIFSGGFDAELAEFLEWYVSERGISIWTRDLYSEYTDWHNEASTGDRQMSEKAFSRNLNKAIKVCVDKGYKIIMKKALNDKRMSLNKLFIGKDAEELETKKKG